MIPNENAPRVAPHRKGDRHESPNQRRRSLPVAPSILSSTMVQSLAEIVLVAGSILATPYLLLKLGPEPYGILGMVGVLASQLGFLHLGLGPAATRLIADARGKADQAGGPATIAAAAALGTIAAVAVAVTFAWAVPFTWQRILKTSAPALAEALEAVAPAVLIAALQPIYNVLLGVFTGQERFRTLAILRLVHGICRLALAVAAVWLGFRVRGVLALQATADVGALLVAARILLRDLHGPLTMAAILGRARALLVLGVPLAAAAIQVALLVDAEKLVIGMTRSLEEFTYYYTPFNAAFRLTVVPSILLGVLLPRFAVLAAAGEGAAAVDLARRATRLLMALTAVLTIPLLALTPELLALWLGSEFAYRSTDATRIILLGVLITTGAYPAHAVVRARAHPLALPAMYSLELVLHILAVWLLVPPLGITGAAIAWTLRVLVDSIANRYVARRVFGADVSTPRVLWLPPLVGSLFYALLGVGGGGGALFRAGAAFVITVILLRSLVRSEDWRLVLSRASSALSPRA